MEEIEDKILTDREIEKVSGGQIALDIDAAKQDAQVSVYEQNNTKAQKWFLEQDESGNAFVKNK